MCFLHIFLLAQGFRSCQTAAAMARPPQRFDMEFMTWAAPDQWDQRATLRLWQASAGYTSTASMGACANEHTQPHPHKTRKKTCTQTYPQTHAVQKRILNFPIVHQVQLLSFPFAILLHRVRDQVEQLVPWVPMCPSWCWERVPVWHDLNLLRIYTYSIYPYLDLFRGTCKPKKGAIINVFYIFVAGGQYFPRQPAV